MVWSEVINEANFTSFVKYFCSRSGQPVGVEVLLIQDTSVNIGFDIDTVLKFPCQSRQWVFVFLLWLMQKETVAVDTRFSPVSLSWRSERASLTPVFFRLLRPAAGKKTWLSQLCMKTFYRSATSRHYQPWLFLSFVMLGYSEWNVRLLLDGLSRDTLRCCSNSLIWFLKCLQHT